MFLYVSEHLGEHGIVPGVHAFDHVLLQAGDLYHNKGEVRPGGLVGNIYIIGQTISLNGSSYMTQGPPLGDNRHFFFLNAEPFLLPSLIPTRTTQSVGRKHL